MPFTVLLFLYRKPGLTPAEFQSYYEDHHMPLIKSIGGENFPISHTRRYIARPASSISSSSDGGSSSYPAKVLVGTPADFDYDCIAELVFENEEKFQTFFEGNRTPEAMQKLLADDFQFLDVKTRAVFVGDVCVTTGKA